jgi:hypothetical protein
MEHHVMSRHAMRVTRRSQGAAKLAVKIQNDGSRASIDGESQTVVFCGALRLAERVGTHGCPVVSVTYTFYDAVLAGNTRNAAASCTLLHVRMSWSSMPHVDM